MSGRFLDSNFSLSCPPGLQIPEQEPYTITTNTLKVTPAHPPAPGSKGDLDVLDLWGDGCREPASSASILPHTRAWHHHTSAQVKS